MTHASGILRPGVRTYKPRRSRITVRAQTALIQQSELLLPVGDDALDLASLWGAGTPVVVEIGSGDGAAAAAMAAADPTTGILAIDVHTPGIGDLLAALADAPVTNVRVIEGDALAVLDRMIAPHALAGVRSFFPDPWPKARHHKRRLVQPRVLDLVHSRLVDGGYWHLATDWAEYAEWIEEAFAQDGRWDGGRMARPDDRPVTRFERRALRDGRPIVDLRFTARSALDA